MAIANHASRKFPSQMRTGIAKIHGDKGPSLNGGATKEGNGKSCSSQCSKGRVLYCFSLWIHDHIYHVNRCKVEKGQGFGWRRWSG